MARRATVVVVKDGKVLLVKSAGQEHWSFPGGEIGAAESPAEAAIRELKEELNMEVGPVKRLELCDISNINNEHKACFAKTNSEPRVNTSASVAEYMWWNMKEQIQVYEHVTLILDCIQNPGMLNRP
jgi:8-oxo-dGTP pyrophosphatase MutT (NUDIX family)